MRSDKGSLIKKQHIENDIKEIQGLNMDYSMPVRHQDLCQKRTLYNGIPTFFEIFNLCIGPSGLTDLYLGVFILKHKKYTENIQFIDDYSVQHLSPMILRSFNCQVFKESSTRDVDS